MKKANKAGQITLWQLQEQFLLDQRAKGNAKASVYTYKLNFEQISKWLAFEIPANAVEYKKLLANFDEKDFGSVVPVSIFDTENIDVKYRMYLEDTRELKPTTVYTNLCVYRTILYYAMSKGYIKERKIVIKKVNTPLKTVYSKAEIDKLLKRPDPENFTAYRSWVVINHILATGNRRGSIVDIKLKDIDFDSNTIIVNRQKNKKPITVPLVKKYKQVLQEYINYYRTDENGEIIEDGYLFCNKFGEHITEAGLYMAVRSFNESRGVSKASLHLFRHTYAKHYITSGGDIFSLQKILGHSSLSMVEKYVNLYGHDIQSEAEEHAAISSRKRTSGRIIKIKK